MFEQHLGRSVTIDQAAALLHVSRRTIYNRIREGKLQTIRTIGGSQRVLLSSLDENRRPIWSAAGTEQQRPPDDDDINPFALRTTLIDPRDRHES